MTLVMRTGGAAARERRAGSSARRVVRAAVATLLTLPISACNELTELEQEAPSRVLAGDLYQPANAALLVAGAISDFECALAQYIVATGLVGDELIDAQLAQVGWDYDRRTIIPALTTYASAQCTSTQVPGLYTPISIARSTADKITEALEGWSDQEVTNRQDLIAQAAAHAGYSLVLLGEAMCTAAIDGGPELTRENLFTEAESRFTKAITAATTANNSAILNMSRVGRARARLNLKRYADARTDAALIPTDFVRNANYSAAISRRENLVFTQMYRGLFSSVDPSYRNLTVGGVPDTRVTVVNANAVGHDVTTPIWRQTKYPTISSPIPIASWDEAQLIIAEAEVETGSVVNAVAAINRLRTKAGLPLYVGATQAEVRAQIIEERRRELFLEGHRLNDIIRFQIQLSPAAGTPFPVKGGVYGNQICFPLPDLERNNNPNLAGR